MTDVPEYAAPAIDKALDILELLANHSGGMSQLDIARAIDRSPGQIFRPLMRLERRGYVYRDKQSGLYELSMRMFDLAHRKEPLRSLISVASRPMRELSARTGQSCNISVLDDGGVRVVAQVESPADFGFRVRVGALFDAQNTPTGRVLSAFSPPESGGSDDDAARSIRDNGYLAQADATQPGITDIVFPILTRGGGEAVAALTVPYISTSYSACSLDSVLSLTSRAALEIQHALGV